MKRSIQIGILMLITTPALQTQSILEIECGWPCDSAMKFLAGRYRVADTLVKTTRGYDCIIRMAPVEIAGYKGFLALHSNNAGRITSYYWTHQQQNVYLSYDSAAPWNTFTDYMEWQTPTMDDFLTMFVRLDDELRGWDDLYALNHAFDSYDNDDPPETDTTVSADRRFNYRTKGWVGDTKRIRLTLSWGTLGVAVEPNIRRIRYPIRQAIPR